MYEVQHVYIEKAQAMPKQGVTSMFTYGVGFGRLLGWLEMLGVPHTLVSPREWTKDLHKGASGKVNPKMRSEEVARRLFPQESFKFKGSRVAQLGAIDAVLIAEYGRRRLV